MKIPNLEKLPNLLGKFGTDYYGWRESQNHQNDDKGSKRIIDAIVGKLGEYDLHKKWSDKLQEPDYSKYEVPEFGADLENLSSSVHLHVKMCSWTERDYSAGWLVSRYDPIVQMRTDHKNNILVFGYATKDWECEWAGWCWVNEMHCLEENYSYYGKPRKSFLEKRKFGVWPEDEMTSSGLCLKRRGVKNILRPIEDLYEVLDGELVSA